MENLRALAAWEGSSPAGSRLLTPWTDMESHRTFWRFRWRIALALVLTAVSREPTLMMLSAMLSMLALFTAMHAFVRRKRFETDRFCGWDEALWLMFLAHGVRLLHHAVA